MREQSRLRAALRHAAPLPALSAVALTGGLVVAVLLARGATWPLRVYAVGLAAAGVWLLVGLIRRAGDELWPRWRPAPLAMDVLDRPRELAEIESAILFARTSGFDFQHRVRPLLRSLAATLLAARLGINLDREPEAARQALGAAVFEALRPPSEPVDREARGIALAELERLVATLEGL